MDDVTADTTRAELTAGLTVDLPTTIDEGGTAGDKGSPLLSADKEMQCPPSPMPKVVDPPDAPPINDEKAPPGKV